MRRRTIMELFFFVLRGAFRLSLSALFARVGGGVLGGLCLLAVIVSFHGIVLVG